MKTLVALTLLAAVIAPVEAVRAQAPPPPAGGQDQQGVQIDARSLMGSTVRGRDGKDIGKVSNLMIDPADGRVKGVIMSMGGTAGMGAKEVTMPWSAIQVGRDGRNIVVTLQNDPLQPAPARSDDKDKKSEGSASPSSAPSR